MRLVEDYASTRNAALKEKIYYEPQDGWGPKEYYYLYRCLHRRLFYHEKYRDEIALMDLTRMTEETKVLMYCIIRYNHTDFMFDDFENLHDLVHVKPLPYQLILDARPLPEQNIYKEMNIAY